MNLTSQLTHLSDMFLLRASLAPTNKSRKMLGPALVFALLCVFVVGLVAYQATQQLRQIKLWERHIDAELDRLEELASQLKDAETQQHRYLITGDERYLKSYRTATSTLKQNLGELRDLTANDPDLHVKIDTLAPLIAAKLSAMDSLFDARKNQRLDAVAQTALIQQSQKLLDNALQLIDKLKDEQDIMLQQKIDEVEARARTINATITFGSFVAVLLATLMIGRDIVERKRAAAALRESTARFHRLAENAMDMIYRYRLLPTPSLEYVSPATTAITGYTPEDFYADHSLFHRIVHPDDRPPLLALRNPQASMAPVTVRWVHKNGAVVWTTQQMVSVSDATGTVVAIEGIVRDITERVQAYQILERRVEERTHEIERRRQVAEGLRDILTILNRNRAMAEILDAVLAQACRLMETNAGAVYRLDKHEQQLDLHVSLGLNAAGIAGQLPMHGLLADVVQSYRPVAIGDIAAAVQRASRDGTAGAVHAVLTALNCWYGALLLVPLLVKNEVYGAIALFYEQPREFSEEDLEIAMTFGDQAAMAIENANLREQAEQIAVAAERSRLARDLHDAVTQTLFSTSLIADVLPRLWNTNRAEAHRRLGELRQLTRGALAEMRTLLLELRPSSLLETGLHELLRQLAEATTGRARIPVTLVVEGHCNLPPDIQIAFYRIAQEALNNVARHAGASRASVQLTCQDTHIELLICDDGQGFDPCAIAPDHLGLAIMRERAEAIGATLQIESEQDHGTRIEIVWLQHVSATNGRSNRGSASPA